MSDTKRPAQMVTACADRFAVRVHGRGVITKFNGEPITARETAAAIVRIIELMYGERCSVERVVLTLPLPPRAEEKTP